MLPRRLLLGLLPFALLLLWTACGKVDDAPGGGGGATNDAGGSQDGGGGTGTDSGGGQETRDAIAVDDAFASADADPKPLPTGCDEIRAEMNALGKAMRACCPTCDSIQCHNHQIDLCCPFSTSFGPDSAESARYDSLVKAFLGARCEHGCTAVVCRDQPSRRCQPDGDGGICVN